MESRAKLCCWSRPSESAPLSSFVVKAEMPRQPAADAASETALLRVTLELRHRQLYDVNSSS